MVATIFVSCGFQAPMLEGSVDSAEDPMLEREEVLTPMDSIFWDRKNPWMR